MTANAEAIEAWNTILFDKFVQYRPILVGGLHPHGVRAMDHYAPPRDGRVVDLGCGFGDTTIELARRVGPEGRAVGLDGAPRFIDVARNEAAGVANASFEVSDIQAAVPGGPYDYAFSRMGVMFFASPVVALRNVRNALAPGGKLCMVVWRAKVVNEAMAAPERVVKSLLGTPEKGEQITCGPGPFSMASPDLLGDQLVAAGYTNITFERSDEDMFIGASIDEAVAFALTLGPAGEAMRLAGDVAKQRRAEIEAAVRDVCAPYVRSNGVYAPSAAWIVTATPR